METKFGPSGKKGPKKKETDINRDFFSRRTSHFLTTKGKRNFGTVESRTS
jgi:hypothetical protein